MFFSVAITSISIIISLLALKESHQTRAILLQVRGYRENQVHAASPKTPAGRRPLVLPPLPCGKPNLLIESYRTRVVEMGVGHGNN